MRLSIILLLFFKLSIFAQDDYQWWNEVNDWDGVTPWYNYLILSPKYTGPNALPVPNHQNGKQDTAVSFEFSLDYHYSKGDQTQNLYLKMVIPVVKNKIGIILSGVPAEHYKTDLETRNIRRSRDYRPEGFSMGDLYITTYIQLLQDHKKIPDLMITLNMKTASGSNLEGARSTDSPGYYFDLSAGRTFFLKYTDMTSLRAFGLIGFYAWQTNTHYRQNDAIMFGTGLDLQFKKLSLTNYFGGYAGYINNGDKPLVNRLIIKSNFQSKVNYHFMYQQGFKDFEYTSFRIGLTFNFKKEK